MWGEGVEEGIGWGCVSIRDRGGRVGGLSRRGESRVRITSRAASSPFAAPLEFIADYLIHIHLYCLPFLVRAANLFQSYEFLELVTLLTRLNCTFPYNGSFPRCVVALQCQPSQVYFFIAAALHVCLVSKHV